MSIISLLLFLGLSAIQLISIPAAGELTCPQSQSAVTLGSLTLKKNNAVVSSIDISGGSYSVTGSVTVTSPAAVSSLDVKYEAVIKATATIPLLGFTTSSTEPIECATNQNVCTLNAVTCSHLENTFGVTGVCDSTSTIQTGTYNFDYSPITVKDYSSLVPSLVTSATAYVTVQFFDHSDDSQVGCIKESFPINL